MYNFVKCYFFVRSYVSCGFGWVYMVKFLCFWIRLLGKLFFLGKGVRGFFEFGFCVCWCESLYCNSLIGLIINIKVWVYYLGGGWKLISFVIF